MSEEARLGNEREAGDRERRRRDGRKAVEAWMLSPRGNGERGSERVSRRERARAWRRASVLTLDLVGSEEPTTPFRRRRRRPQCGSKSIGATNGNEVAFHPISLKVKAVAKVIGEVHLESFVVPDPGSGLHLMLTLLKRVGLDKTVRRLEDTSCGVKG